MFIKIGDATPLTIIDPIDIDDKSTKKALDKTVKNLKLEEQKNINQEDKK